MINLKQFQKLVENKRYYATMKDGELHHFIIATGEPGKWKAYPKSLLDDEVKEYLKQNPSGNNKEKKNGQ